MFSHQSEKYEWFLKNWGKCKAEMQMFSDSVCYDLSF